MCRPLRGENPAGTMRALDLHTEFFRPTKRVLINDDCERPLSNPKQTLPAEAIDSFPRDGYY